METIETSSIVRKNRTDKTGEVCEDLEINKKVSRMRVRFWLALWPDEQMKTDKTKLPTLHLLKEIKKSLQVVEALP